MAPDVSANPVRVLFVNTRSALGADVAVHVSLMRSLDPRRCAVFLATNRRSVDLAATLAAVRDVPGLAVTTLDLGYELAGRGKVGKLIGAAGNVVALLVGLTRLARLVRRERIDIIHTTDRPRDALLGTVLARFTGRRNVIHMHVKWQPPAGRAVTWAIANCSAVLAISRFVEGSLVRGGVPRDKIHTALNGIELEQYDSSNARCGALRAELELSPQTPLIGIVARIMVWKGHLDLIEALPAILRELPDARLVAIGKDDFLAGGDGVSYRDTVSARAGELGVADRLTWLGWRSDMASVYADLDVVCVPSHEEPFGLVVTEAMAMERPVVGYASGALPEIVEDGRTGVLVPAHDIAALASSVVALLRDPRRRAALGAAGRSAVCERFTALRLADDVTAIYYRIAGREESILSAAK